MSIISSLLSPPKLPKPKFRTCPLTGSYTDDRSYFYKLGRVVGGSFPREIQEKELLNIPLMGHSAKRVTTLPYPIVATAKLFFVITDMFADSKDTIFAHGDRVLAASGYDPDSSLVGLVRNNVKSSYKEQANILEQMVSRKASPAEYLGSFVDLWINIFFEHVNAAGAVIGENRLNNYAIASLSASLTPIRAIDETLKQYEKADPKELYEYYIVAMKSNGYRVRELLSRINELRRNVIFVFGNGQFSGSSEDELEPHKKLFDSLLNKGLTSEKLTSSFLRVTNGKVPTNTLFVGALGTDGKPSPNSFPNAAQEVDCWATGLRPPMNVREFDLEQSYGFTSYATGLVAAQLQKNILIFNGNVPRAFQALYDGELVYPPWHFDEQKI